MQCVTNKIRMNQIYGFEGGRETDKKSHSLENVIIRTLMHLKNASRNANKVKDTSKDARPISVRVN